MKVKELIEKLQEFDPELTVCFSDSEDGTQVVTEIELDEDAWVVWDKATVLNLYGEYVYKEHIDPKYFFPQPPPAPRQPNLFGDNLKKVYDDAIPQGTMILFNGIPAADEGFVTFNIIKGDDK